jgi:hypothetical protein
VEQKYVGIVRDMKLEIFWENLTLKKFQDNYMEKRSQTISDLSGFQQDHGDKFIFLGE